MVYFARWKVILILAITVLGLVYASPNLLPRDTVAEMEESLPGWAPGRQVNLGLDLQGGSHLLLRVEYQAVVDERLQAMVDGLRTALREARIGYTDLGSDGQTAGFTVRDPADADAALTLAQEIDPELAVSLEGDRVVAQFTEEGLTQLRTNAVSQSIEIVRRRIDETGTNEPNIQRQGQDRILVQLPGIDDPARVKSLLGQTAQLTFQMVDDTVNAADAAEGRVPPGSELLPSYEEDAAGQPLTAYVVRKRVNVTGDHLTNAQPTFQDGQPVVSFNFDSIGARRFGDTTSENIGRQLAIVLDGRVVSAPVIQSTIRDRGVITGRFTVDEATDLALLLRAGALPAPLEILEERTVGPGLGADSIAAGQMAALIGFVLVIVFMAIAYGLFGIFANIALILNLALILAALSALQATLTLPGIAGIVLTVGMAVDANVLIFERIREEVRNGRSPISAIDAGYGRALQTIVDSNLTTLIAAVLLFLLGSGPVKGFAVTLAIGIVTSMFSAMMVTRLFVVTWLRRTRPKAIPI